jgi:NADH-quinone oxidoreductase subunit A
MGGGKIAWRIDNFNRFPPRSRLIPPAEAGSPSDSNSCRSMSTFPPLFVYAVILLGFVVTNLVLAKVAGPKKKTAVKQMPYESGMDPVGDARQPFDVKFYLVAILFLVFDVELLFLYPWATSAYLNAGTDTGIPVELRGTVFVLMLSFMSTLVIAYIYAWRKGVFRWR